MRGTNFSEIPISSVSQSEIEKAIDIIESIESSTLRDIGAWFEYSESHGEASLDFRIPHADHKHSSSIPVDVHATNSKEVFESGKYSAVRFETIGQRCLTEEKLERLYGFDEGQNNIRELQKEHDEVIKEREYEFDEIMHSISENYEGIQIRTDTGDGAFSGNDHRPHVRLISLNVDGRTLGNFVKDMVREVESFYGELPYDRFERV